MFRRAATTGNSSTRQDPLPCEFSYHFLSSNHDGAACLRHERHLMRQVYGRCLNQRANNAAGDHRHSSNGFLNNYRYACASGVLLSLLLLLLLTLLLLPAYRLYVVPTPNPG